MEHPLRAYRRSLNLSLDDAAAALGVSKAQLSRVETGNQDPQPDLLRRIAEWSGGSLTPNEMLATPAREPAQPGEAA